MTEDIEYFAPRTINEAIRLRESYGNEARYIAGGTNLLYMMRRGVRRPKVLINLGAIKDLDFISYEEGSGLRIGALTKISRLERSDIVKEKFPLLERSASKIATPQIRNMATVAGNLCQENWCWYLMEGFHCWMNGGRYCYAPSGDNRYHHSLLGGYFCVAVNPSDLATAFTALDARIKVLTPSGEKVLSCDELFPGFTKVEGRLQQNTLKQEEVITELHVPQAWAGVKGIFIKYAPRLSIDFAISSVAVLMTTEEQRCKEIRIVFGGIATKPYRARSAELVVKGKTLNTETIKRAVDSAFEKTVFLTGNAYRITLSRGLLRSALERLTSPRVEDEMGPA